MVSNEGSGASAAVALMAAGALDFGMLDKSQSGILASVFLGAVGALWFFIKRDYKRFVDHLMETEQLKNRVLVLETQLKEKANKQ